MAKEIEGRAGVSVTWREHGVGISWDGGQKHSAVCWKPGYEPARNKLEELLVAALHRES